MSAHSQAWHDKHNASNYPGTRQLCILCGEPTERCEEDAIYTDDGIGPWCMECFNDHHMSEAGEMRGKSLRKNG